jgi:hypothetical protein
MNTIIKFIIVIACALALMYFDSLDSKPKESINVGNSHVGNRHGNFRVRIGNLRLHRVCVVSTKQGRRQVKCPVCDTWVRNLETRSRPDNTTYRRYECANEHRFVTKEKIERVIVASQIKKRKKHELARVNDQICQRFT